MPTSPRRLPVCLDGWLSSSALVLTKPCPFTLRRLLLGAGARGLCGGGQEHAAGERGQPLQRERCRMYSIASVAMASQRNGAGRHAASCGCLPCPTQSERFHISSLPTPLSSPHSSLHHLAGHCPGAAGRVLQPAAAAPALHAPQVCDPPGCAGRAADACAGCLCLPAALSALEQHSMQAALSLPCHAMPCHAMRSQTAASTAAEPVHPACLPSALQTTRCWWWQRRTTRPSRCRSGTT